ncbi:MAG: hypothetical protein HY711_08115 [Candidatus Melainabacteria bacterium]|nr:hypothetical protein [Candidatus Melainabacteria bacterium]
MHNRPFDQLFNDHHGQQGAAFEYPVYREHQDVSIVARSTRGNQLDAKLGNSHNELARVGPISLPTLELVESQSARTSDHTNNTQQWVAIPKQLFESDCPLTHTILPDGTMKTEQAAADGTMRTHLRHADGTAQERIADRYGRPLYVRDINQDGQWTICQMQYLDSPGRVSPFLAGKRISTSDGEVQELNFGTPRKIAKQA